MIILAYICIKQIKGCLISLLLLVLPVTQNKSVIISIFAEEETEAQGNWALFKNTDQRNRSVETGSDLLASPQRPFLALQPVSLLSLPAPWRRPRSTWADGWAFIPSWW